MSVNSITFYSEILRLNTEIKVILPDLYECNGDSPYKVLWLFHGANADCNEWIYQSSIARYASKYPLAVVLASTYDSYGVNMANGGYRYADFLEKEFPYLVREMYPRFSEKREDNYIIGASMGGYAAVRWAFNCPYMFCKAGSFAGALAMDDIYKRFLQGIQPGGEEFRYAFGNPERFENTCDDIFYMAQEQIMKPKALPELFMLCGKDDFGYRQNIQARNRLIQVGATVLWKEVEGIHGYDCWDPYIPEVLAWMMNDLEGGRTDGSN
jgi:S-formylglutathione hydrolase FrmB